MSILLELLGPIWPYIAGAGIIVAGWFTARRQGAQAAAAKRAAGDAKAYRDTIEKVTDETLSDDPAADIRKRLRERAKR